MGSRNWENILNEKNNCNWRSSIYWFTSLFKSKLSWQAKETLEQSMRSAREGGEQKSS